MLHPVALVGAGPGDPGLVTVRGLECLRRADVILYDNLAAPALLAYARPDADKRYVGKKRTAHALTQDQINALLIEQARAGRCVVRLKGGDPYLFGRGGEEAEALAAAGIPFEVVPGVSSAMGAAAYAGIPLTHREHTSAVTFVTGHEVDKIDWSRVGASETIVVFMGLVSFGEIARRLVSAGRSPDTPAAAIRWATRRDQRTLTGTLGDLAEKIAQAGLKPPTLIIVGEVVRLREMLNWFEKLPLFGKTVVVTRAREQAGALATRLAELGAKVVELPTIQIEPPAEWQPLDLALARLESFDWLIFTSANGVRFFTQRLDASPRDLRALRARICAIGPATAAALAALHLKVDLMPAEYVAESVVAAFEKIPLEGARILLPRAAVARDLIPKELEKRGARVTVVEAYRTVPARDAHWPDGLRPDWVVFTSSSTVENFHSLYGPARLQAARVASIGPVTSATARRLGIEVAIEAAEHTIDGLVAAILTSNFAD
ncbi:MAG: uroporphyrinogen-III C-methyltransferase [Acidobacteria bacterium]|nr:uroporphyrinogen-III C-methyltransferase [Acidobacteriota bacterium]